MTMTTTSPYADAYTAYWDAGWRGILPLPYQRKTWPPEGYTGHNGIDPSYADCATWADDAAKNIALRMPMDVVGIDVDHYGGKTGGDTLHELVAKHGPLPPTYLSTSRDDGMSGIRLYRIPPGTVLPTKMPGIDFVQRHHRYAVVHPSIHPEGRVYRWIDELTGLEADGVPRVEELPYLPESWIRGLAVDATDAAAKADIDGHAAKTILTAMPLGEPCQHVRAAAGRAMMGGDRHDSYNEAVLATLGAGRRGCPGAVLTLSRLHAAFISELTDAKHGRASRSEAEAEWQRGLMGAIAIVANEAQGTTCPDDVLAWAESLPPSQSSPDASLTQPTADPATGEIPDDDNPYQRKVREEYTRLRIADDAKAQLAALKAGQAPPLTGLNLTDFLAQPEEDEHYRVADLWPAEGRVMLAAAAKSGKTTMVAANLIPCLVDGETFLNRYAVERATRRVVYLNMEVGPRTMRRWMSDCGVVDTDRVTVANLRGQASALALGSQAGRERFASWLRDHDAEVVILDPLAPVLASLGLDENKNADVAVFFSWWGEALMLAGVVDDLVVHHTGHAGDRSRGASRLLDEPDAIWTLTKDREDDDGDDAYGPVSPTRYLAATGRDVEMFAEALAFDPATRRLSLTGLSKGSSAAARLSARVTQLMSDGRSRTANEICDTIGGDRTSLWKTVKKMESDGVLTFVQKVKNGRLLVLAVD